MKSMSQILVVEDDPHFRSMVARILKSQGYGVHEAANGRECISMMDSLEVDVVIVDMLMPEVDGIETIIKLKQTHNEVKIIGMSGGGMVNGAEYLHMAKQFGVDQTLLKPFTRDEMMVAIHSIM